MRVHKSVWHDKSSKGCGRNSAPLRHDCWRGDIRIFMKQNGSWSQIARKRKRFKEYSAARAWIENEKVLKEFTRESNLLQPNNPSNSHNQQRQSR